MKNVQIKKIILISIGIISLYCIACKDKKVEPLNTSNIILRDKPLNTLKSCIEGKWQMHYSDGGFTGDSIEYQNTYVEFIFNYPNKDTIKWYNDTLTYANGLINFNYEISKNLDYVYMMTFVYLPNVTQYLFANKIVNDTLIIEENYADGFTYYLTKIK